MTYYPYTKETAEKFDIRWNFSNSDYGWRIDPHTGRSTFHTGVDHTPFKNPTGDIEIINTLDGVVENLVDGNGALYTYVRGDNGEAHMNVHLKKYMKPHKSRVKVGDVIGLMGKSGKATGVHTHFEVRKKHQSSSTHYNPAPFIFYNENMQIPDAKLRANDIAWYNQVKSMYNVDLLYGVEATENEKAVLLRVLHENVSYLGKTDADDEPLNIDVIVDKVLAKIPEAQSLDNEELDKLRKQFHDFVDEISDSIKDKEKAIKDEKDAVEKAKA